MISVVSYGGGVNSTAMLCGLVERAERHRLPIPRKSACWFCPATRRVEVQRLAREHPELWQRAVAMERNAQENLGVVKGLGRHWSWEGVGRASRDQLELFSDAVELDCMCFDGEEV